MKFLVVLAGGLIYTLLSSILNPIILNPLIARLNTSDDGILMAGFLSGLFTIIYIGISILFVKYCFEKIDQKRRQDKENANITGNHRATVGPWICMNCGTQNKNEYGQCKKCGQYRAR